MKWEAVFWDFDGVVLDSVHVKTRAFAKMFRQYGQEIENAIVEYHLANGGVSRYEKFEYYYRELLKKPLSGKEISILGEIFSNMVLDEVLKCPFVPGAFETLQDLKKFGIPCFVVSGTPDEEIKQVVSARKLSSFFLEVHGSPASKEGILEDILGRKGYFPWKCVFLGDSMTDYFAARKAGIPFIGINFSDSKSPFPEGTIVAEKVSLWGDC